MFMEKSTKVISNKVNFATAQNLLTLLINELINKCDVAKDNNTSMREIKRERQRKRERKEVEIIGKQNLNISV